MPLSLFDHRRFAHYRSNDGIAGDYAHTFGGALETFGLRVANADHPFHLMYRLDLSDHSLPVRLEGCEFLPLVYGFHYAARNGTFIYRVLNDFEIEILAPEKLHHDSDFPYPGHPLTFAASPVSFCQMAYDRSSAEDALSLQAIFGLDGLSAAELQRAVRIGLSDESYVCYSREGVVADWTDEEILRRLGRAPFMQGAPSKSCDNPECTAEVAYHVDEQEIEVSPELADVPGEKTMTISGFDVRVDTMRVIAIHQPEDGDELIWGDSYVQIVFEFCDCCQCFRVSNQCT